MTIKNHWLSENYPDLLPKDERIFNALQGPDGSRNNGFFDRIGAAAYVIKKAKADIEKIDQNLKDEIIHQKADAKMQEAQNEAAQILSGLDAYLDNMEAEANRAIEKAIEPDPPKNDTDDLKQTLSDLVIQMFLMNKTKPEVSEILRSEAKSGNKRFYQAVVNAPIPLVNQPILDMARSSLTEKVAGDQLRAKANVSHTVERGRSALFLARKKIEKISKRE